MRRAQYSMEFLLFFAFLSMILIAWMTNYTGIIQDMFLKRDISSFEDVGESIRLELTLAANVQSGYKSTNLEIPISILGNNFTINNTQNAFYLRTDRQDFIYTIPYTIGKLKKGQNTIYNVNGVVAVGEHPPIVRPDGNVNFTTCSDLLDNDGDTDVDLDDADCSNWFDDTE